MESEIDSLDSDARKYGVVAWGPPKRVDENVRKLANARPVFVFAILVDDQDYVDQVGAGPELRGADVWVEVGGEKACVAPVEEVAFPLGGGEDVEAVKPRGR